MKTMTVHVGLVALSCLFVVGCRIASRSVEPMTPRPMPGEPIVQDGSHAGSMLLYDGHFVGGLKGTQEVQTAVDRLTPPGTFSVIVNDARKRIFNVDSLERLDFYIDEVEHVQGPLPPDVSFSVRSSKGVTGTVRGKEALRKFLAERFKDSGNGTD